VFPQSTYIFKHALTREVVYESILSKRRTQLHRTIGTTLEELHKGDLGGHCGILCEHFIAGKDYAKGAEYARLTAKRAKDGGSFVDAVSYSEKRISCLEKLPQSAESLEKTIDARTTLGLYLTQTTDFVAAKEAIEPIIDVAVSSGYRKRISQIYAILTAYYTMAGDDGQKALCYGHKALEISETLDDMNSKWASTYWLGAAQAWNCEWEGCHYNLNRGLDITVSSGHLVNIGAMQGNVSWAYSFHGKIDLGYQTSLEALRSAEEAGDVHSAANAHISHGIACYGKRFLDEAEAHLRKGLDLCARIDLIAWYNFALDYLWRTYFERSEYDRSIDCHTDRIAILKRGNYNYSFIISSEVFRASAQLKNGQQDINLNAVRHWGNRNKVKIIEGSIRRIIADILLDFHDHHISEAEGWIQKAIESDKEHDVQWELAMDHVLYGELLVRKGEPSTARQQLHKAIEVFQECGADGWVQRTEEKLAGL
jgi:tetratricopeptide (TPR) repeat protein